MTPLNYSRFSHIFFDHAIYKDVTAVCRALIGTLVNNGNIENSRGEIYTINSQVAKEFYDGTASIYPELASGADYVLSKDEESDSMCEMILEDNVAVAQRNGLFDDLLEAIKDDGLMNARTKAEMIGLYDAKEYVKFFRAAFAYAMSTENKTAAKKAKRKAPSTLSERVDAIKEMLEELRLKKPVLIVIPDDLEDNEVIYASELFKAYSEDAMVAFATKSDLVAYPKYARDFERQRKDFYAAESIRVGLRDCQLEDSNFDELKKEINDGVEMTASALYSSGLEKIRSVMDKAVTVPLSSLLALIPSWIGPSERKGVVHMLVNDGKIKWVDEDE
ncbi:MAG: hypothetical protein LKG11_02655 [Bacilli bacterium]|jgi:hypothetical protein|nr:hypothetical protein [Bacilli bacterium]